MDELTIAGFVATGTLSAIAAAGLTWLRKKPAVEITEVTDSVADTVHFCDHTAVRADNTRGWVCRCGRHVHKYLPRAGGKRICFCGQVEEVA